MQPFIVDEGTLVKDWVRAARESQNLSRYQLAEKLGVKHPRIYEWEDGRKSPTISSLIGVAAATGADLPTLIGELVKRRVPSGSKD